MPYDTGAHTVFYHRYHIVWITKYRYTVLEGAVRARIREIIRQVCAELGVTIVCQGFRPRYFAASRPPCDAPHRDSARAWPKTLERRLYGPLSSILGITR